MTESGWFRIEGPAGHEVVYWVVSPAKLSDSGSGFVCGTEITYRLEAFESGDQSALR